MQAAEVHMPQVVDVPDTVGLGIPEKLVALMQKNIFSEMDE